LYIDINFSEDLNEKLVKTGFYFSLA
jgi:hypothetical protein